MKYMVYQEELYPVFDVCGPTEEPDQWGTLVEINPELVKRLNTAYAEWQSLQEIIKDLVKKAKKNG